MRVLAMLAVLMMGMGQPEKKDGFVQWAEPPGEATEPERVLVEKARKALEKGDVSGVLVEPAYMPVHARTEFREVVKKYAKEGPLTIAGKDEPGLRLTVELEFVDRQDKPVPGLVYVYHTSAKGWYSDKGAHIRAESGDHKHARLFGYGKTDKNAKLELRTTRPGGYPNSELPAHIHVVLEVEGTAVYVGEVRFDDDPRLTPEERLKSLKAGDVVVRVDDGKARAVVRVGGRE